MSDALQKGGRVPAVTSEIERVAAADLSYEDFLERYIRKGRPLVISGVAAEWPAMSKWTPLHFKERFGAKPVAISYDKSMPFDAFVDAVLASCDERPGPYMFRSFLHESLPELLPDVIPQNKYAFPGRHASPLMPEKWRRPDGYLKLLIGGVGSKFPVMHFDGENSHAFITQIYGTKEFVVFAPSDTPYVYPSEFPNQSRVDDPLMQDRERFPLLEKATPYRSILGPGDMVFVPARWWHAARAASTSISVCTNMLDRSNWQGFVMDVAGRRRKLPLRMRLTMADWIMSGCEWLQIRRPALARALALPHLISPISAEVAPEPSRQQLHIRIPTA
ncbi:MAG: cupin-like domain-containing protein [Proteobacteria bacterium]|nr:cupin-like domain-containing protein [Pseudomonadota bacterium]